MERRREREGKRGMEGGGEREKDQRVEGGVGGGEIESKKGDGRRKEEGERRKKMERKVNERGRRRKQFIIKGLISAVHN